MTIDAWTLLLPHSSPVPALARLLAGARVELLDIGVRDGFQQRWNTLAPLIRFVGVEPDAIECARLGAEATRSGRNARFLPLALGTSTRETLHICREPGCSSIFEPNMPFIRRFAPALASRFEVVETREIDVRALDDVAAEHGLAPDALKLDIQGSELGAMRSGPKTVSRALVIELEVELNPQYIGQPLFGEVDAFLRQRGFELLGLRRVAWRRQPGLGLATSRTLAGGQLIHGDALYVNAFRLEAARHPDSVELAKWLVALLPYRQHDLIAQLISDHPLSGGLTRAERHDLLDAVVPALGHPARRISAWVPELRNLKRAAVRALRSAWRDEPGIDWHDGDLF